MTVNRTDHRRQMVHPEIVRFAVPTPVLQKVSCSSLRKHQGLTSEGANFTNRMLWNGTSQLFVQ